MRRKNLSSRITSALVAVAILFSYWDMVALAGVNDVNVSDISCEGSSCDTFHNTSDNLSNILFDSTTENLHLNGYLDGGYVAPRVESKYPDISAYGFEFVGNAVLPESYSSVDKGYVTDIKNQGVWGTCWSFGAVAAMESYAITHGYVADKDEIDLSEFALAYMTFDDSSYSDPLGGTEGDITTTNNIYNAFNYGGNNELVLKTMSKWAGIVNEDKAPYSTSNGYTYNKDDISYILTGQKYINMKDTDMVKKAIVENGAVSATYWAENDSSGEYGMYSSENYLYHYNYKVTSINHGIAIVGWDDTIDKSKFTRTYAGETYTPEGNGAWLVKNSWGKSIGDNGYIWISYYDVSISLYNGVVYEIAPADKYDYNYQYDGSTIFSSGSGISSSKYANVFTVADDNQEISAVSFAVNNANIDYSIQIYKNPDEDEPETGEACLTNEETGSIMFAGYYTVDLSESISLSKGDRFAVVIKFSEPVTLSWSTDSYVIHAINVGDVYTEFTKAVSKVNENESYFYFDSGSYFYDAANFNLTFCIKAFANDTEDVLRTPTISGISQSSINAVEINFNMVNGATDYEVLRSTSLNQGYTTIGTVNEGTFIDENVEYGNTYYYKVRAHRMEDGAYSEFSSVKSITVSVPSAAITNIEGTSSGITLEWNEITGVSGYRIYRLTAGESNYELVDEVSSNNISFKDTSAKYNTEYTYIVKSYINRNGEIVEAIASAGRTACRKLDAPGSLTADSSLYGKITLSWSKVEGANGYIVWKQMPVEGGGYQFKQLKNVSASTFTYTDSGLTEGENESYMITAYIIEDDIEKPGNGVYSGSVFVRYAPLDNITWTISGGSTLQLVWASATAAQGMNQTGKYNVYISENSSFSGVNPISVTPVTGDTQKLNLYNYSYLKEYYVRVVVVSAFNKELTAVQVPGVKIGGYKEENVPVVPTNITSANTSIYVNEGSSTVSKLKPGTSAGTLLALISEKKYCVIKGNNLNIGSSSIVGTGMKVCIMDGATIKRSYSIIVTGDVNGDGKVNITDMIAVKSNILGKSYLTGLYKLAGDVSGDGKVNITDFIKIKAAILGKSQIDGVAVK